MASRNDTVYTAARRLEQMDDLKELDCIPLKMDVTMEENLIAATDRIAAKNGGVDILINNAGISLYGSLEEALTVLLGPKAGGLSPTTIRRLVEVWQDEHKRWQARDLSTKRYVYVWPMASISAFSF